MGKLNSRVPAFSLAEMLVVMLLSGLAAGIIYFAYYTVNRYHMSFTTKYEQVSDANTLKYLLNLDFDRCDYVKLTSQGFSCLSRDSVLQVKYELLPDEIIRSQGPRADTFKMALLATKFWFNGKKPAGNALDVFYLEAVCLSDTVAMKFTKTYDASSLLYHVKKDTVW